MSRREWLDLGRLALLRLRVQLGRPLPAFAMACLAQLDAWAVRLHREGES
jgi:hypothetical protein